jgi:hypothetical protein
MGRMAIGRSMIVFVLLLLVAAAQPPPASAPQGVGGATFVTKKNVADLEKCLTDKLSKGGEVTSVPIEGVKTLMYSTTDEPPMMIDLAPPTVKVTTKFAIGTEPIVKSCL